MKTHKQLILIIGLVLFMSSCNNSYDPSCSAFKSCRSSLLKQYKKTNIFSHFPKPTGDPIAFSGVKVLSSSKKTSGYLYQFSSFDDDNKNIDKVRKDSYIFKTKYDSQDNIIIDLYGFKYDRKSDYNMWHKDKYPVPKFEEVDFLLGTEFEMSEDEKGNVRTVSNYVVPSDLEVVVVDSKSGYFWKASLDNKRPETLREWKHGYSRGYAVSEKYKKIVYWTIVW